MAEQPQLKIDFDAAKDQLPTFNQTVNVVADADAMRFSLHPFALSCSNNFSASSKSSGVVILMLRAEPSTMAMGTPSRSTSSESSVSASAGKPVAQASKLARRSNS